jgi:alkylation response protein AidB-like acyl-CoA dehydrogenase
MNFDFTETQQMVRESARTLAKKVREGSLERDESHEFPADLMRELAQNGLMGVNVALDHGGSEAGVVAYALAVMEIAAADPAVATVMCVNNMVCEVIQEFGTPEQVAATVPHIQSGEWLAGSFCLSEPASGSDAASMRTTAVRDGDEWVLNGSKAWITSGQNAGVFIVWAKTPEEDFDGKAPISAFLVDPATPGITVGPPEKKMGQHCSDTVSLAFDDVRIPAANLLGELGGGFRIAMMALDGGRIGIASQCVGIGEESLRLATAYATEREQFGRAIARHQAIQFKLADMATEIDAARMMVLRAAWLKEQGDRPFTREASMAKLMASEMAGRVSDEALQIHGGYGYTHEYRVEKLVRDARVTRIYEGTSEIQRIVIGREVLRGFRPQA